MTSRDPRQRWVAPGERSVEALRHEIADERGGNPLGPITVVVPSFYSAYFLRRAIALQQPLFNVQFLRLEDFAETLAPRDDERPPLSRLRASELVFAVASDETIRLPAEFERIRGQESFQRALHRTLDDLDAAGVEAGSLDRTRWRFTPAILDLHARYSTLAEGFVAASATARDAARVFNAGGPDSARFGKLILVLAEEPAIQHRELVSALASHPETRTLIQSAGEEESDGLLSSVPGIARLPGAPQRSEPHAVGGSTRLVSALDPAEETLWVVRDVLDAARNGTSFSRVGVFYENHSYGSRLTEAFQLADIPVSGPSPVTLAQTAIGRWIHGVLSTLDPTSTGPSVTNGDERFARDKLAAWVTGSRVKAADGAEVPGAAWDVISRKAGVVSGADSWNDRLAKHSNRLISRIDRASRQDESDTSALAGWRTELDETNRLREFVRHLAAEPIPADQGSKWTDFVRWLRQLEDGYGHAEDDDSSEAVSRVLDSLADLDNLNLPSPSFERFKRTLEEELKRPVSRVGSLGTGVFVAPLRQAVGCDFDRIYIVGMAEGSYPSTGSEDPLLPDFARNGVDGLKTLAQERVSARRRYLTALSSGQIRTLTWPRSQPGATRQVWPARWFVEAAEAASNAPLPDDLLATENNPIKVIAASHRQPLSDPPMDRHDYELKSLAAWQRRNDTSKPHFLLRESDGMIATGHRLEQGRFGSGDLTRWDGAVGPNTADWSPTSLVDVASSTRLETWANCPFRYFLTYEVGVEPTETPEAAQTLSPLDRGSIIHDILDEFVKATLSRPNPTDVSDADRLEAVANRKLDEFEVSGLTGRPVLWKLERERIRRGLLNFLDVHTDRIGDRGQRPIATELGFGVGEGVPPVVVKLPGGREIRFRGWIDRVDAGLESSDATVIDYKSGRSAGYSAIDKDPVDAGRHLQLPLYALAVREWKPDIESIDAEFWFVMDDAGSKKVSTSLAIAAPRFEEVVARIVDGIEQGVFPAYPGDGSRRNPSGVYRPENCAYCAFDRICPGGRDWTWEQKSTRDGASAFVNLGTIGSVGDAEAGS